MCFHSVRILTQADLFVLYRLATVNLARGLRYTGFFGFDWLIPVEMSSMWVRDGPRRAWVGGCSTINSCL
jgi:hypothetical protein